jgi:Protein of unknown function (DUF3604)
MKTSAVLLLTLTLSNTCFAKEQGKSYSPYAAQQFPMNVYFGDTHLHTSYSPDASVVGNSKLGPDEAYKLAKGETVTAHNGMKVKLIRPLDFLVVSDHSEYLGLLPLIRAQDPKLMNDPKARRWYKLLNGNDDDKLTAIFEIIGEITNGKPTIKDKTFYRSAWDTITKTADKHNAPGKFTAFIGYEWTSTPKGDNLHRVVIYRDGKEKASKFIPYSAFDSENPEDLWNFLAKYEKQTGGKIFAIPHNGNISNGLMFNLKDFKGKPITKAYAKTRIRWEPLVEVTQIKGDGEAHPKLSPEDKFANYEKYWDKGNLDATQLKKPWMLQYEYVRSALKLGLLLENQLGVNPYKFGMIGSTDAHTSLAAVRENNYWGKLTNYEPSAHRWSHPVFQKGKQGQKFDLPGWQMGSAGYAAVWATANTRAALFDAMKRKETYATTGPRMRVRFFGGWNYQQQDLNQPNLAAIGYAKGVPMGGDLIKTTNAKSPTFLVSAVKDAEGANLDRIQIIKGWLDKEGKTHEKIINVALSDGRKNDANGKAPDVGNTVDVKNASYENTIGDVELKAVWTDVDFDPNQKAFYYVRVLQIPTPRWTAFDAKFFNIDMPDSVEKVIQERAYTSPIWYTP